MSAIDTLRDALFGSPPTEGHKPSREGVFKAFVELFGQVDAGALTMLPFNTVAEMNANTTAVDGQLGYVFFNNNTTTDVANGIYQFNDATNTWSIAQWFYDRINNLFDSRLDVLEDQQVKYCSATFAADVFSLSTAYNTSDTTPSIYEIYRFAVPGSYAGFAVADNLKVKINGGTSYPLYNHRAGLASPAQFEASKFVMIQFMGGFFKIVYPELREGVDPVHVRDLDTGVEWSYDVRSQNVDWQPESGQYIKCRFIKSNQTQQMRISLNSGAFRNIYELDGSNVRPGRIVGGAQGGLLYTLQYLAFGDPNFIGPSGDPPYWVIIDPPMDQQEREALTALQLASQSMLTLRKRWEADNLTAWEAIPRTTVFDHSFATAGDQSKYRWAAVNGDYNPYDHNAGGYIEKDFAANPLFFDPNHHSPGPGFIQLPFVIHPLWHTNLAGLTTMKNAKLTLDLRLLDFELPPGVILAWHYQAQVVPGSPGQSANYLYMGQLVSDAAGFGVAPYAGIGWPPVRRIIPDTFNFDFTVRFIDDDAYWMQLGTSRAKAAIGGSSPLYTVRSISDAFAGQFQSMILVALYPQQHIPTRAPQQAIKGKIRCYNAKLERQT